jgi:DNA-directed RNA polymerase subunit RPC12/RpoP
VTLVPPLKTGHYVCPQCKAKFNWGFGFTENVPPVKDEDRIEAVCPVCRGLEFKNPIEILTGKKVQ